MMLTLTQTQNIKNPPHLIDLLEMHLNKKLVTSIVMTNLEMDPQVMIELTETTHQNQKSRLWMLFKEYLQKKHVLSIMNNKYCIFALIVNVNASVLNALSMASTKITMSKQ